ncbi:hypothetical protein RB653_003728 [Dictyostelium firmibasis]|uniref:Uncharacterized protein n=1 Tax=Dictyostelium firmibasis TaxID=79012 RepID=A0AAN7U518_9MYCE
MLKIAKSVYFKHLNSSISKNKCSNLELQFKSFYSTTTAITTPLTTTTTTKKNTKKKKELAEELFEEELYLKELGEKDQEIDEINLENENIFKSKLNDTLKKLEEMKFNFNEELEILKGREPQVYSKQYGLKDRKQWSLYHKPNKSVLCAPMLIGFGSNKKKTEAIQIAFSHPKKFHFLPYAALNNIFDWGDNNSLIFLFNFIAKKLNFESLDDWYKQDFGQIANTFSLSKFCLRCAPIFYFSFLSQIYPYHNWDIRKFQQIKLGTISHVFERMLKEDGYISRVQKYPPRNSIDIITPIAPYHHQLYREKLGGTYFYFLSKMKIKNYLFVLDPEILLLFGHLSLYQIVDNNNSNNNDNNNYNNNKNNKNSDNSKNKKAIHKKLVNKNTIIPALRQMSPFKLDKEKVYKIEFSNNKPFILDNSIFNTICLICEVFPYLKPWLFKYQDEDSEKQTSQKLIKEINERFNIKEPSQWYDLTYNEELEELLPSEWYHCFNFIQYLNIEYPSFVFEATKFKDEKVYEKFYMTHSLRSITSIVNELLLANGKDINKLSDWCHIGLVGEEESLEKIRQYKLPFKAEYIHKLIPLVHLKHDRSPNEYMQLLRDMVTKENMPMEDLYSYIIEFEFPLGNNIFGSFIDVNNLRTAFPNLEWATLKFPLSEQEVEQLGNLKVATEYYNYIKNTSDISHPLDLISYISKSNSYVNRKANKKFVQFGLLNIFFESVGIKDFPKVNTFPLDSSLVDSYFRKVLELGNEDIGIDIDRFTVFSELQKHVKK